MGVKYELFFTKSAQMHLTINQQNFRDIILFYSSIHRYVSNKTHSNLFWFYLKMTVHLVCFFFLFGRQITICMITIAFLTKVYKIQHTCAVYTYFEHLRSLIQAKRNKEIFTNGLKNNKKSTSVFTLLVQIYKCKYDLQC